MKETLTVTEEKFTLNITCDDLGWQDDDGGGLDLIVNFTVIVDEIKNAWKGMGTYRQSWMK